MIGQTVGHYRVLEHLGEGGMGVVYRAEDTRLGRSVALKFLAPELTRDRSAKERFLVEARAASALDHPNVCTVYEAGETDDGQMFLAMAFYEGETLKERLARGPLAPESALDLALQIARGLERAHEAAIVHRDVKPGNVMVTARGEVKLLDFGLAKLADSAQMTRAGTTLGTPAYMSPEQLRGEPIDARTDVWSLGAVLYEALAGRPPFGAGASGAAWAILHEEPLPISRSDRATSQLERIVHRALAKDPARRYPTARELRLDLERAARGSLSQQVTVPGEPAAAPSRRLPIRLGRVTVLVMVGAFAAWWGLRERGVGPAATPGEGPGNAIAVFPFTVRGGEEYAYLGEGLVDLLATKLDGAGELRSVDPNAVLSVAARQPGVLPPAAARAAAERLQAGLFVLGDVLEAAGRLHLSASLYDVGSERPLSRASVEGGAGELFTLVDDLTAKLLAEQVGGPAARIDRTAALTTESLPALKHYLTGESLFRAAQFTAALEAFRRAVAEDPAFALAWYRVSVAAEWATRPDLAGEGAAQAARLADRLSERDRALLEARSAARRAQVLEAERLYRLLVGRYPDEVEAWVQLGEVLFHHRYVTGRSFTLSRQAWERVLAFEPDNVSALLHLARVAAAEGNREELARLVERLLPLTPESDRRLEIRALAVFGAGDRAAEPELLSELRASEDRSLFLATWNVAFARSDLPGCVRILQLATEGSRPSNVRAWAHGGIAYLEAAQGHWGEARRRLAAAIAESPAIGLELAAPLYAAPFLPVEEPALRLLHEQFLAWDATATPPSGSTIAFFNGHDGIHPPLRLYGLGLLGARLGEREAFGRAAELAAVPDPGGMAEDFARSVRGYEASLRGDWVAARDELAAIRLEREAYNYLVAIGSPHMSRALDRYLLGAARVAAGDLEAALPSLASFPDNGFYDLAFAAPAEILAGEALERLDRAEEAAVRFESALSRWRDADPALAPWLDRARAGLLRVSPTL